MNIRIVTDSTCDLPEEIVSQQEITVIPLHINVGEKAYLDGVDLTRLEFYAQLPDYFPAPKTAAPGSEVFVQAYERLANEGAQAILSIHISETLSATINSARTAAEQFTRIPVTVLDSSQLSLGTGFIVEKAAQMAKTRQDGGRNHIRVEGSHETHVCFRFTQNPRISAARRTNEFCHCQIR